MRESGLLMPLFQRLLVLAPAILADPEPTANRPRPPRSSLLSLTLGPLILWERSGRRLIKLQTDIARATRLGIQVNGHLSCRIWRRKPGFQPALLRRVLTLPFDLLDRTRPRTKRRITAMFLAPWPAR